VPATHQDQAVCRCSDAALAAKLPQRNVGAAEVSGQWSQNGGSRSAFNPQLAHPADDPVYNNSGGGDRPPLRATGSRPDPNAGWSTATL